MEENSLKVNYVADDWRKHIFKISGFVFVMALDLTCSGVLFSIHRLYLKRFHYVDTLLDFTHDSFDLMLLSVSIIFIYILCISCKEGKQKKFSSNWILQEKQKRAKKKFYSQKGLDTELLIDSDEGSTSIEFQDTELMEKKARESQTRATRWKNSLTALAILVLTVSEIFIGIKVVKFDFFSWHYTAQAVLMSSLVLWVSIELWLYKDITNDLTRETGHYYPQLHPHPLYYNNKVWGHACDTCKQRGLREAYRCPPCDFDMCLNCVSRNNNSSAEGLLRNDKGVKQENELSDWQYLKKAFLFSKKYWFTISIAFLFLFLSSAPSLLLPQYQGKILDRVIKEDREGFKNDIEIFVLLCLSLGIFGGIRNLCFNIVGQKLLNDVQDKLFHSIIRQDIAFFDGISTGDLTSRLWNDATAMISPINTVLTSVLSSVIFLIGGLVMCLATSWRLSILAFTTIGPITLLYRIYSKWSKQINKEIWACLSDANAIATEAISNIRTVRAFSQEPNEEKKYKDAILLSLKKGIMDSWASAGTFALTSYIDQSISILLLWYGGSVVLDDPQILSIGNLITFQLYWNMINSNYQSLSSVVSSFTKAGGAAQRIITLLDNMPDIDPYKGTPLTKFQGNITLENVEFHYQMRPEQKVLKGINLSVNKGQVLALVGKSGGGKSTLIHLLLRFYDPKKGRILIDGVDYTEVNPISLRRNIGIVSQETQLFNMSIEENIAYGVQNYTQQDLIEAAKLANAHEFIVSFEDGYQTRVGERGTRLSGGQKQRIALARVFLRKPSLLLLDEATSSLDTESEALVQEAIDRLIQMRTCTVVLVAHRLSTVINADKIAVVDNGIITEEGNHEELIQKNGVYSKLVKRQIQKMKNTLNQDANTNNQSSSDIIDNLIE